MTTTTIEQVNSKLKKLPKDLLEEVEKYIDYLSLKHNKDNNDVQQWHKDIVLKRIKDNKEPVDAFEMIKEIESKGD